MITILLNKLTYSAVLIQLNGVLRLERLMLEIYFHAYMKIHQLSVLIEYINECKCKRIVSLLFWCISR